jgi:ABC-type branched-subunit amino acid transport system substrate-binding protein
MTAARRPGGVRLTVVAVITLGLVGTACGARVPEDVRQHAASAVLSTGGSVQGSSEQPGQSAQPGAAPGGSAGGGPSSNPGAAAAGQAPGQPSGGGPGAGGGGSGHTGGPRPSSRPSGGTTTPQCSGGTDVGLTPSAMTLGTVATLTGPVSGLFEGAVQGIESFSNYLNTDNGGLCGRKVSINAADDGTNCSQNQNVTQSLIAKTFALVGSFSLYDGCGATIIRQHPTVPDVHLALDPAAETPPNHFDISAGESGYATGMFHYYAQKYGSKVKHVGTIVENIPSAISNQENQVNAAESQGWHFVMSIKESPTTSNFTQDFQKLCGQAHMQVFFLLTEPAQNAATMMRNERQAGCHGVINVVPIAYDQAFLTDYGSPVSDLNGIQGWQEYALFFNKDEAANIPEVRLLQQWFQRSYPGKPLNLYAMYSWADGRLFQEAAEHAGSSLSRSGMVAALRKIKNFSANGLISPRNPGQKPGVHCYILWQLENGVFSRVDDPKTGYRCDGHFLPRH